MIDLDCLDIIELHNEFNLRVADTYEDLVPYEAYGYIRTRHALEWLESESAFLSEIARNEGDHDLHQRAIDIDAALTTIQTLILPTDAAHTDWLETGG